MCMKWSSMAEREYLFCLEGGGCGDFWIRRRDEEWVWVGGGDGGGLCVGFVVV